MKFKANFNKRFISLLFITILKVSSGQQDPMYTQYMFNTQTINPAYTGTWESLGFMSLGRHQWTGIEGNPQTYTFSIQAPLRNERIALGLNLISDKIGLEKKLSVSGDFSYLLKLSNKTNLRLGLKSGVSNYSNNLPMYKVDPEGRFDPLFAVPIESKLLPNFGVGAYLYSNNIYVGLSVPKLVHNEFVDQGGNYSTYSEIRHYFLTAGLVFELGENIKFKPTLLTKATRGSPVEVDFSANFLMKEKVWLGVMYRTGDAFGFIAQWIFNQKLRIGYAIDYTTTSLGGYQNGTHEIMVSYELIFLKKRYVSPRYF